MVIKTRNTRCRKKGMLSADLIVAMGILTVALIPFSLSFWNDARLCQIYYRQSIGMELVDGEMEKLKAGEWRQYSEGTHIYTVKGDAAQNLRGQFNLEITNKTIRLTWTPDVGGKGATISREGKLP